MALQIVARANGDEEGQWLDFNVCSGIELINSVIFDCEVRLHNIDNIKFTQHADIVLTVRSCHDNRTLGFSAGSGFKLIDRHAGTDEDLSMTTLGSEATFEFLLTCLTATASGRHGQSRVFRLIGSPVKGNICRSDIFSLRMVDSDLIAEMASFAEPLQLFDGQTWERSTKLVSILQQSAGGVLLRVTGDMKDIDHSLKVLSEEIQDRMSFDWVLPGICRKTVVIVEGSRTHPEHGGTGPNIYLAARALGIDMVVLDEPGHWLEGLDYSSWRKAFIPIRLDFPPPADFDEQIVKAVQSFGRPVDGIITFCDAFQSSVSMAAKQLGLFAPPASAYAIATDKFKTSKTEGHYAFQASNLEEVVTITKTANLPYPLIVKPCNGWGSEGVFRVRDDQELFSAVKNIDTKRHGAEFVIEEYCDGPEVDVNFVLYDGEIMFSEIADDYPKGAEKGSDLQTFIELDSCYPSALPEDEQTILRESFHKSLLRLGLHDGIYHCEGRVHHSRMEYQMNITKGIYDLGLRKISDHAAPSAWLIEINPRPPGMKAADAIETTYGVDYWGLALLIALRDKDRVRSLSQPFLRGAQYYADMIYVPTEYDRSKAGIFASDDICTELIQRRPDLAKYISRSMTFVKKGERVPHPQTGLNTWVAYLNVFSRQSRTEVLKLAQEVRSQLRIDYI